MVVVAYWKKVNSEAGISPNGVTLATVAPAWNEMDLSTPSPSSDDITTQVQEVSSLNVKMETRGSNERNLTRTDKRPLKVGPAV